MSVRTGLFDEQVSRKPNRYAWTQEFIDKIWTGFWTPHEFSFASDYAQFKTEMTPDEQRVIVNCLSAIGQVEIAVKTFWARLGENFPHPSISDLGFAMANSEVVHNIAYEKLLDKLMMTDVFEKNLLLPEMGGRVQYLRKYLKRAYPEDQRKQYVYAIILFTLFVENVSLFSQFYVVLWFNRYHNILRDTAQQVRYTRNEEMIHSQVGIRLIQTLRVEYPELFDEELEERVRSETAQAFGAECGIIDWILGDYRGPKLTPDVLKNFVADRLNRSLISIGYSPVLETDELALEESHWLDEETIGNNMVDFFNSRPVEYTKKNRAYVEEELF